MFWTKEESIPQIQRELEQRVRSFEEAVALIQNIPSIQEVAAAAIVAEIGVDMDHSPMASHLASWAGVCPGNRQSGGKLLSGATTAGNAYLRAILEEVA